MKFKIYFELSSWPLRWGERQPVSIFSTKPMFAMLLFLERKLGDSSRAYLAIFPLQTSCTVDGYMKYGGCLLLSVKRTQRG